MPSLRPLRTSPDHPCSDSSSSNQGGMSTPRLGEEASPIGVTSSISGFLPFVRCCNLPAQNPSPVPPLDPKRARNLAAVCHLDRRIPQLQTGRSSSSHHCCLLLSKDPRRVHDSTPICCHPNRRCLHKRLRTGRRTLRSIVPPRR
uniref:(northern house mosquito) hypothetical protein n=1 Tax=Culex pipiens TaxID=7175 RepID=A0A8D8E1L9_CULPI